MFFEPTKRLLTRYYNLQIEVWQYDEMEQVMWITRVSNQKPK